MGAIAFETAGMVNLEDLSWDVAESQLLIAPLLVVCLRQFSHREDGKL